MAQQSTVRVRPETPVDYISTDLTDHSATEMPSTGLPVPLKKLIGVNCFQFKCPVLAKTGIKVEATTFNPLVDDSDSVWQPATCPNLKIKMEERRKGKERQTWGAQMH